MNPDVKYEVRLLVSARYKFCVDASASARTKVQEAQSSSTFLGAFPVGQFGQAFLTKLCVGDAFRVINGGFKHCSFLGVDHILGRQQHCAALLKHTRELRGPCMFDEVLQHLNGRADDPFARCQGPRGLRHEIFNPTQQHIGLPFLKVRDHVNT